MILSPPPPYVTLIVYPLLKVLFSNIFGSTGSTTTTTALGRRKRGVLFEEEEAEEEGTMETMKVLQALEEYPLRHRTTPAHCDVDQEMPCTEEESPLPQIAQ